MIECKRNMSAIVCTMCPIPADEIVQFFTRSLVYYTRLNGMKLLTAFTNEFHISADEVAVGMLTKFIVFEKRCKHNSKTVPKIMSKKIFHARICSILKSKKPAQTPTIST